MSNPVTNMSHLSSALNITEESMVTKKQGIVSILGFDTSDQKPNKAGSLRRTLSADMSSKKWLTQNGIPPLKKIASSEEFSVSIMDSSSVDGEVDYEEAPGQFDIWNSIQQEKKNKETVQKPDQFDIWSAIISEKAKEDSNSLPPPYIHPLVKRSASSLSEKSLEICTESLGSETGSDVFSSYSSSSETSDMEEDKDQDQETSHQQQKQERVSCFDEEPRIVKYNYDVGKKLPSNRSFPPPIPSLSHRDGGLVRMKTFRINGRLVLEAVSVPSQKNFLAQRQDGRLVLTFAKTEAEPEFEEEDDDEEEEEEVRGVEELEEMFENRYGEEEKENKFIDDFEEEESDSEIEGVIENRSCEMEEVAPKFSSGVMNVHRLAVMMKKPIWLANRNTTWPKNFDEMVKFGEQREEKEIESPTPPPLAQSLPPRPQVARLIPKTPPPTTTTAAAASFNAYEYYWKRPNQPISKAAAAAAVLNPLGQQSPPLKDYRNKQQQHLVLSKNLMANYDQQQQQLLVLRGNKGDYFVPFLEGCKEPKRSLLFWEPYCIATS